jgi:hypothetical protein
MWPGTADTQHLQVQPAQFFYLLFVVLGKRRQHHQRQGTVWDMYFAFFDIDMVEQILVHESDVALHSIRLHGVVLIQVKGNNIFKRQPFFFMQAHQLGVNFNGVTPVASPSTACCPAACFFTDKPGYALPLLPAMPHAGSEYTLTGSFS